MSRRLNKKNLDCPGCQKTYQPLFLAPVTYENNPDGPEDELPIVTQILPHIPEPFRMGFHTYVTWLKAEAGISNISDDEMKQCFDGKIDKVLLQAFHVWVSDLSKEEIQQVHDFIVFLQNTEPPENPENDDWLEVETDIQNMSVRVLVNTLGQWTLSKHACYVWSTKDQELVEIQNFSLKENWEEVAENCRAVELSEGWYWRASCMYCRTATIFEEVNLSRCDRCDQVYYCGIDCQRKDWHLAHKKECKLLGKKKVEVLKHRTNDPKFLNERPRKHVILRNFSHLGHCITFYEDGTRVIGNVPMPTRAQEQLFMMRYLEAHLRNNHEEEIQ
jgi:hypothetical protein